MAHEVHRGGILLSLERERRAVDHAQRKGMIQSALRIGWQRQGSSALALRSGIRRLPRFY